MTFIRTTCVRALLILAILWACLVFMFVKMNDTRNTIEQDNVLKRINKALTQLENSRQKNDELKLLIESYLSEHTIQNPAAQKFVENLEFQLENSINRIANNDNTNNNNYDAGQQHIGVPSLEYELIRRRIRQNTKEMWNYFSSELDKIKKNSDKSSTIGKQIEQILQLGSEHKRSMLTDIDHLQKVDGYEKWRQQESDDLSDLVQKRLNYLQNPKDCKNAKKLVCKLNKGCGYGCQLHHVVYCFIVAYATERTMILKSKGWRYHKGGWEEVFQPISDTCTDVDSNHANNWPGQQDSKVLILPIIDSLRPRPSYLPLAIPDDIAPRLMRLHGEPIVWFVGQFLKYLLRPKHETQEMIEAGMEKLGWKKPIVGVHVRRTDKVGTEADFHTIDEYMTHVEDYYLTLETNNTKIERRVFLASDDPRVINEARKLYTNYEIIGDTDVAKMADVSTRYTDSSLNGIILDIHMLSLCDYLVCTFSSQVCRIAYEIMQTLYPDASTKYKSLDDIYYFGGQNAHNVEAILSHRARNKDEIHMQPGDLIGFAGNHWNGFSKGKNVRTNQVGLFPLFKTIDKIETVQLPNYQNANRD